MRASCRTWVRGALVLMLLLGLTWTFGLLYLNQATVGMAYAFTILNSLQGLFIFIFHCVQNDKVSGGLRRDSVVLVVVVVVVLVRVLKFLVSWSWSSSSSFVFVLLR